MMVETFQEAAQQAAHLGSGDEITWAAVTAWATAKVLEWLKCKAWFPMLTGDTERANRWAAWLTAAVTSVGIAATFDAVSGEFVIKGSVAGIVSGVGHMIRQIMLQEIAYKKFVRKDS